MKELITDEFIVDSLKSDLLGRNRKLFNIINLLINQNKNSIVSLNGEWGCGKTVLAKQIEYLIKNPEKYKEICDRYLPANENSNIFIQEVYYYNAWENDAINMPVQSLIFQMIKYFEIKYENTIDLKNTGKKVFDTFLKIGTMNLLNCNDIEKLNEIDYKSLMNNITEIENLKKCFNNVIEKILKERKDRLLIIIDELDRCRPTYAIEMLECIKHFYDNNKVTFLVVTNNVQLSRTVKKVYGAEFDGDLYLQRFYDSIINLASNKSTKSNYITYILDKDINSYHIYNDIIRTCINYFDLELRQLNSFMMYEKTAEQYLINNNFLKDESVIVLYLCCIAYALNNVNHTEFSEYVKGKWKNIDEFVLYNPRLLDKFKKFHFFIKLLNSSNKKTEEIIKDIYLCTFGDIDLINQYEYLRDLFDMYYLHNTVNLIFTLQF